MLGLVLTKHLGTLSQTNHFERLSHVIEINPGADMPYLCTMRMAMSRYAHIGIDSAWG